MNAFLTKDHHTKQRLHALRGYARHADRLRDDSNGVGTLGVYAAALAIVFALTALWGLGLI
jgi:hypothetical protein